MENFISSFPGSVAAFSLVALAPEYQSTNPVVRVRRSSDSTQQDFTANQVINGDLISWIGGGDGWVTTLYDQSGNGRNASQASTSLQGRVVISGVLQTENGQPCWVHTGGGYERYTYNSSSDNATFFTVLRPAAGENFWTALSYTNAVILLVQQNGGGSDGKGLRVGANIKIFKNGTLQNITSRTDAYNSFLPDNLYLISATDIDMTDSLWNTTKDIAGYGSGTSVSMNGKRLLSILYDSNVADQREEIESTISSAFGPF